MFRTMTALAAAAMLCGVASADDRLTVVEAELVYDSALLSTEEGAYSVLRSLTRQASRACRTLSMTSVGFSVDEGCVDTMVDEAVMKIGADTLVQARIESETEARS